MSPDTTGGDDDACSFSPWSPSSAAAPEESISRLGGGHRGDLLLVAAALLLLLAADWLLTPQRLRSGISSFTRRATPVPRYFVLRRNRTASARRPGDQCRLPPSPELTTEPGLRDGAQASSRLTPPTALNDPRKGRLTAGAGE